MKLADKPLSAIGLRVQQKLKRLAAKRIETQLDLEPMDKCLHNKFCRYLDAPGKVSPMCEYIANGIFWMDECPLGKWFKPKKNED